MIGEPVWLAPTHRRPTFVLRLAVFGAAEISAAVVVGAALGWVGASLLPASWSAEGVPWYVVVALGALGLWIALREIRGQGRPVPQIAWQVPRHWLRRFWLGAAMFGAVMGAGFLTRQVSLLFYLYLLGAFLSTGALTGALLGALYGGIYLAVLVYATVAWREVGGGGQDELLVAVGRRMQIVGAVAAPSIAFIPFG